MDLNINNYSPPTDSLGRKIGYAKGFGEYTDDYLAFMKNDLALSMNMGALRFIRDHYKANKLDGILLDELYYLDRLVLSSLECAENFAINDVYTDAPELAKTYLDFTEKHRGVSTSDAPPMSLYSASQVAPSYTRSIGLYASENKLGCRYSIVPENTAFLLLTPGDCDSSEESYKDKAGRFFSSGVYLNTALFSRETDKRGIAYALSILSQGIYADIYSIPELPETPELSFLADSQKTRFIIAADRMHIYALSECALEFGLNCTYFAKATTSGKFVLRRVGRTAMDIDISLIRAIGRGLVPRDFLLSEEPFVDAANSYARAVLGSVASGASLPDITVMAKYRFPKALSDKEERGACLSSILGAYRTAVELCTAVSEPCVEYTDVKEAEIEISAYTEKAVSFPDVKEDTEYNLFLLSYNRSADGLPDFESFRLMSRLVGKLASEGAIFASAAVIDTVSDAIIRLKDNFEVNILPEHKNLLDSEMDGILIVTEKKVDDAVLIGSVQRVQKEAVSREIIDSSSGDFS